MQQEHEVREIGVQQRGEVVGAVPEQTVARVHDRCVLADERSGGAQRPKQVGAAGLGQEPQLCCSRGLSLQTRADRPYRQWRGDHRDLGDTNGRQRLKGVADDRTVGDPFNRSPSNVAHRHQCRGEHNHTLGSHCHTNGGAGHPLAGLVLSSSASRWL